MNPRRHLLARGYAATVIALRHLIPLAWIAAVVLASISLPDLASAPPPPLPAPAPAPVPPRHKDGRAKRGAARRDQALRLPPLDADGGRPAQRAGTAGRRA